MDDRVKTIYLLTLQLGRELISVSDDYILSEILHRYNYKWHLAPYSISEFINKFIINGK